MPRAAWRSRRAIARASRALRGQLIITVDRDYCLLMYPLPGVGGDRAAHFVRLPTLNKQARRLQRLMVGYASEVELDGQGRFCCRRSCGISPPSTGR
jgi:MraZ protein